MTDFTGAGLDDGPDDLSVYLTSHAHHPGAHAAEDRYPAAGHPGDGRADAGGGTAQAGTAQAGGARPAGPGTGWSADDQAGRRDDRLAEFAQDRCGDIARPSAWHVMILNDLTGADDRCPDATDGEALGLLGRWKTVESWAAARMLGVAREMIRRRAVPEKGMVTGDLPWEWERDLGHEVAAQLRISLAAAAKLLHVAWSLEARLPRVGDALSDGRLDPGQARMIVAETDALPDDKATAAEELILAGLDDCNTWADLLRLVQRAVCTVDPDGARRRREEAERESARVRLWRESSGACALAGHALPTDQALAAYGHVEARAQYYHARGIKEYTDLLRVMAYLDLLNGVPAEDRIAQWTAAANAAESTAPEAPDTPDASGTPGTPGSEASGNGSACGTTGESAPADAGPAAYPPDSGTPGEDDSPAGPPGALRNDPGGPELRARVNLTVPMETAAGHGSRPGEAWELGVLDPALARELLKAAARSPGSEFCVTVTDEQGYAVGHGCCRPQRPAKPSRRGGQPTGNVPPGPAPPAAAPPRSVQPGGRATFTRRDGRWGSAGPPGGFGSWTLTLPGTGTTFTVDLKPVPTHACDHAYASAGHDPSDWLRHVVQVRDGKCSFPACGRHARESDFEHAVPHQDGGKTCACNCHACSRACHQVKQRPGWSVTSPTPGWHQWTTPSGRTYVQGPWRYPA